MCVKQHYLTERGGFGAIVHETCDEKYWTEWTQEEATEAYFFPPLLLLFVYCFWRQGSPERRQEGVEQPGAAMKSCRRQDAHLQLPGQVTESFHWFPAAHRMGTSAAENLIRYAESETFFTSKRNHFCLQRRGGVPESTAHFAHIVFCHYVMLSCQIAKRDEGGGTTNDNGGLLSCGRSCDGLITASLSKCHFVAIVALFVCTHDSVAGCIVCVCVPVPMVSHYVAG